MKFNGRWLPDFEDYRKECLKIAQELRENPSASRFKQNPIYKKIINNDNRSRETAEAFYNYIKEKHSRVFERIREFQENDMVGNPSVYIIDRRHIISPGTLRFMKVLGDIIEAGIYSDSIVEIGGGYGGQCVVMDRIRGRVYVDGKAQPTFSDYTLIDIPESLEVARAYLGALGIAANFMSCEAIEKKNYDLVISDYCISEMDREGIDFYFDNVIKYCKAGYFTCNKIGETDYLIERLKELFTIEIVPEFPKTSKHENIIIYAKQKL